MMLRVMNLMTSFEHTGFEMERREMNGHWASLKPFAREEEWGREKCKDREKAIYFIFPDRVPEINLTKKEKEF